MFTRGSEECLRNAKKLLEDAKLLIGQSSFGVAQSLAIVAMEEAGKAVILELANLGLVTEEVVELAMTKHALKKIVIVGIQQSKLLLGKEMVDQVREYIIKDSKSLENLEKEIPVNDLERKRQNGFYVDVNSENGKIKNTPASVSQTDAVLSIKRVEIYLSLCTLLCECFRDWQKRPRSSVVIRRVKVPIIQSANFGFVEHPDYDVAIVFDEI